MVPTRHATLLLISIAPDKHSVVFFTPVPRNTLSCCCRQRFRPRGRDKLVCLIAMHMKSVGLASRAVLCTSIAFDRCKALLHSRPDSTAYCTKNIYTDVEKISNITSVH